jgi:acetoin utilization deacetylase AcuC-like enzyme
VSFFEAFLWQDDNGIPLEHLFSLFVIFFESLLGMGNEEYAAAFSNLVLPILCNFKPELIIIACGLDAVQGDLIGDCGLTPDMYYSMTRSLLEAAPKTPIVVALEGGYNIDKSSVCMEKVALALLDESPTVEDRANCIVWSSAVRDKFKTVLLYLQHVTLDNILIDPIFFIIL